jgi:hypothetical protein
VTAGVLAPTHGETHEPEDQKDNGRNPQEMYRKPSTEQNQNEQQRKYEQHETSHLSSWFREPLKFRGSMKISSMKFPT